MARHNLWLSVKEKHITDIFKKKEEEGILNIFLKEMTVLIVADDAVTV